MATFAGRMIGAARLDVATYEDVEADQTATGQALVVVLLSGLAGGIGSLGLGALGPPNLVAGVIGSLVGWLAWAALTYIIGTRLLPEPQTKSALGELLRTVGFASTPGVFRVFGVVPVLGRLVYVIVSIWLLIAMVIAVRQALDYTSTARAVGVCVVGWLVSVAVAVAVYIVFAALVL